MNKNLVFRLRAEGQVENVGDGTRRWELNPICIEAAEEIERLQLIVDARDVQIRRLAWEMAALEAPND